MNYIKSVFILLLLSACAHHHDVRPSADGIHKVIFKTDDKDEGGRDALSQANNYCEEVEKKRAFIVDEISKYTGSMQEDNYKITKNVGKAATIIGGTTYGMGGKTESSVGGIVGLGGVTAGAIAGKGYTYEMKFKCQ